jgi:glycosyltransferase involved in cell wall biosynthesis
VLGRLFCRLRPLKKEYRVYFFFPFYHMGGAEKVHYQIAQAVGGSDCIIFFTKKSQSKAFFPRFRESGCDIKDISVWTDNKWLYFLNLIFRGIISGYINRQQLPPVVFNGQCNFGYKISPWVRKGIRQIELIHSFNTFSYIRTPFLPFISTTVMISRNRLDDHVFLYDRIRVPLMYLERLAYIPNAIALPADVKKDFSEFRVLFSGRGGKEKRLHLVMAVFKELHQTDSSIRMEIMGDMSGIIEPHQYPFVHFYGYLNEEDQIHEIYQKASVLLLTSGTEGFPMVVIEAMAYGCAIISTAVGDIPLHIKQGINGFLFSDVQDEKKIVQEGVQYILELKKNPVLLQSISENNIRYARQNFGLEKFNLAYQNLLHTQNQTL